VPNYIVPTENVATVEFSSVGSPIFAMYSKGNDCSGMTRLPRENAPGNPNATPLSVAAGVNIAFGATGTHGASWCNAMTSFTPVSGARYHVALIVDYPKGCSVEVYRDNNGQQQPEPSARIKEVRSVFPMYPTGSFCHSGK